MSRPRGPDPAPPPEVVKGAPGSTASVGPPDDSHSALAHADPDVAVEDDAMPDPALATPASKRPGRSPARPSEAQAFVDAHNRVRAKHCAKPLTWSPKLAQVAQQWANTMRDRGCSFEHSNGKYGENLAGGTGGTLDPAAVVGMWYDEVSLYRFPNGGFSMKTGHFTQVVWRGTTQVGCGRSTCKGMDYFVCEYDPPGNWEGQYRDNVLPAGCR